MKTLAVGDVHTKTWIIDAVEKLIDDYDKIIFMGDFLDDWGKTPQDSLDTVKKMYLLNRKYPDKILAVRANHDLPVYYAPARGTMYALPAENYIQWDFPENQYLVKYLVKYLANLPTVLEIDDVLYSHAGITDTFWDYAVSIGDEIVDDEATELINKVPVSILWASPDGPVWTRPEGSQYIKHKQVFGHTPHHTCEEIKENIWLIDTFSTNRDGTNIGDGTVLEVTDGKKFNPIKLV